MHLRRNPWPTSKVVVTLDCWSMLLEKGDAMEGEAPFAKSPSWMDVKDLLAYNDGRVSVAPESRWMAAGSCGAKAWSQPKSMKSAKSSVS